MQDGHIVDCIVLNYNDADTTINMVNRIRTYDVFNHIIMVDNCSPDGSADRLEKITDKKVILLRNTQNTGYGAGNNMGVFYSHTQFDSDFAVIANPDVEFTEQCIVAMVEDMLEFPRRAVAAPMQLNTKGEVIPSYAWHLPGVWRTILTGGSLLKGNSHKFYPADYTLTAKKYHLKSVPVDCVPGAMLMVRTEAFCDELGGYDPGNFLYREEDMLARKVKEAGMTSALMFNEHYIHRHAVSINKSYPNVIKRKELLLKARMFYLTHYTGANGLEVWIAKKLFRFYLNERKLTLKVKMLWKK